MISYAILLAPAVIPGVFVYLLIYPRNLDSFRNTFFSVRGSCVVINSSGAEAEQALSLD